MTIVIDGDYALDSMLFNAFRKSTDYAAFNNGDFLKWMIDNGVHPMDSDFDKHYPYIKFELQDESTLTLIRLKYL